MMPVVEVPKYRSCTRGCIEDIKGLGKVPVQAVLDPRVYHFQNTKEPYMLRVCPKCEGAQLIIL